MRKITPHLWFDKEAKAAAELYVSLIPNSRITNVTTIRDTPSGDCDIVTFELDRQPFIAISAGPLFRFNPSVSFHIRCKTPAEVDAIWKRLAKDGTVLMELGEYPFSKRYGWLADRFGLSWQIICAGDAMPGGRTQQIITPAFLFVGSVCGKAEEAVNFYTSIFSRGRGESPSKLNMAVRYGKEEAPDKEGTLKYSEFALLGQDFVAMDSAYDHKFSFNEAISFIVPCENQEEIDYLWEHLSADPKAERCGWCKDRYGLSWQIIPTILSSMLQDKDKNKVARVTQAFLQMKKFDIKALQDAYAR